MSEWISVEERLPEINETILLGKEDWIHPIVGFRLHGSWCEYIDGKEKEQAAMLRCAPTHWMPLPDLPRERGAFYMVLGGTRNSFPTIYHRKLGEIGRVTTSLRGQKVCEKLNEMWAEAVPQHED